MNEQGTTMNQHKQQQQQQMMSMNQNMMTMNQMNQLQSLQPQMAPMSRNYGMWAPQPQFQNPNLSAMQPPPSSFNNSLGPRTNWKGKKVNKHNVNWRKEQQKSSMAGTSSGGVGGSVNLISGGVGNSNYNNYNPPTLNELQHQNRVKTRKFFPKKKFNKNYGSAHTNIGGISSNNNSRSAPYAPRNTTSFLIRAKKSGGIASLVSPCPVTPAVLPTPIFSPSREVLVDMAKEEWGVDGYGSMKGLIRLRSPGNEMGTREDEEEDEGGSSESDVEEHIEVERRLDHDLSRFEMIYNPNSVNAAGMDYHTVLENRVDDQDTQIAHLEEENLVLKERLFLMERELGDLRRRMRSLEWQGNRTDGINEEVVENESENESRGEEAYSMEDNNDDFCEENAQGDGCFKGKGNDHRNTVEVEASTTIEKNIASDLGREDENTDRETSESDKSCKTGDHECKETNQGDTFIEASKIEESFTITQDNEVNKDEENKCYNAGLKAQNHSNAILESSDHLTVDVCVEDDGIAKDGAVMDEAPAS